MANKNRPPPNEIIHSNEISLYADFYWIASKYNSGFVFEWVHENNYEIDSYEYELIEVQSRVQCSLFLFI